MKGRFFSLAMPAMARFVPELVPPISSARFWLSIHSRALEAATSALFWWSAVRKYHFFAPALTSALPPTLASATVS